MEIPFFKMSGAGNDFVVVEKKDLLNFTPDLIKKLCNRNYGIGADGLLTVEAKNGNGFYTEYYNADSSKGILCANGARCAVAFASMKNYFSGNSTNFNFFETSYKAEIIDPKTIKLFLNPPSKIKLDFKVRAAEQLLTCHYVNLGSEHAVIFNKDLINHYTEPFSLYTSIDDIDVVKIGREIRNLKDFKPNGLNVNFIEVLDFNKLKIRTYERGVENETLACGSGSTSSAIVYSLLFKVTPKIELVTRSGESLFVEFKLKNKSIEDLSLTGPAIKTFEGIFSY